MFVYQCFYQQRGKFQTNERANYQFVMITSLSSKVNKTSLICPK